MGQNQVFWRALHGRNQAGVCSKALSRKAFLLLTHCRGSIGNYMCRKWDGKHTSPLPQLTPQHFQVLIYNVGKVSLFF